MAYRFLHIANVDGALDMRLYVALAHGPRARFSPSPPTSLASRACRLTQTSQQHILTVLDSTMVQQNSNSFWEFSSQLRVYGNDLKIL